MVNIMSDPFIQQLRNEISLEDEDKIFTSVGSLKAFLLIHGENRLEREKEYINNISYIDKNSGEPKKLDWDSKQKASNALHINFMNSFVKAVSSGRTLIFSTATLLPADRIEKNQDIGDIIIKQHTKFSKYHTQIRSNNANRGMKFIKVYELHKSFDIHSHGSDFVNDDIQSVLKYINSVELAKDYQNMGRIKLVIDPKYKDDLITILNLSKYDEDNYYQDEKEFKKGSALVFGFFRPTATNKEKIQSMVSYVIKYVNKTVYKNGELSLASEFFKYFKIRAFTYSAGVLPSLTVYKKLRYQLMQHNSKYGDMYELQKDIDSGLVSLVSEYKVIDPKTQKFPIPLDFSQLTSIDDETFIRKVGSSYSLYTPPFYYKIGDMHCLDIFESYEFEYTKKHYRLVHCSAWIDNKRVAYWGEELEF